MNNLEQLEATFDAKISPGVLKEAMKEAGASKGDLWKLPFDQLCIIDGLNLRGFCRVVNQQRISPDPTCTAQTERTIPASVEN
jgi:hypothetical protein